MTAPALPGAEPTPFDAALAALDVEENLHPDRMEVTHTILGLDAVRAAHRAEVERAVAERDGARQEAEQWRTARRESEDYIAAIVKATGDTWTGHIDFLAHIARLAALSARVAKLEAEQSEARNRAARLEAALRFYADPANYRNRVVETSTGTHSVPWSMPIESDIGDKARAALEDKP